jgi:hypothetical protein
MTKFFIYAAMAVFALACGSYDDQGIEPTDEAGELGDLHEAINIGTGAGFSASSTHNACSYPGPLGQDCRIPGVVSVNVKYCFNDSGSPFSAQEKIDIRAGVARVDSNLVNWTFTEVALLGAGCVLEFVVGSPGSATTLNVDNYSYFVPLAPLTTLTSPAGISHVNGSWKSFTSAQAGVDTQKINTLNPNLLSAYRGHVGGHSAALFLGLGTTTNPNSPTRRAFGLTLDLTSGEICRANALNSTSPTTVSAVTSCGT